MAQIFSGSFLTVTAPGVNITTSGTSASATIPNDGSGNKPNYVRISATVAAYVRFGKTSATAAAGDMMVIPADAVVVQVPKGYDTIAAIQVSSAGIVQVSPLDNS